MGKDTIDVEGTDFEEEVDEVEVVVDVVSDEEVTPLDAAEDAQADFYAAQRRRSRSRATSSSRPIRCSSS